MKTIVSFFKRTGFPLFKALFILAISCIYSFCCAKDVFRLASGNIQIVFYNSEDQGTIPYKYKLTDWPFQAKIAIADALTIVEQTIEIGNLMTVGCIWSGDLDAYSTLAETYTLFNNVQARQELTSLDQKYKYPRELLNQIVGGHTFSGQNIVVVINALKDWNYDKDRSPMIHQQDLITVCLHELLHGLGISSSFTKKNESKPYIYDRYIVDEKGISILDYPSENSRQIALRSNNLFYSSPNILHVTHGEPLKLHAPKNFSGSSICHLDRKYQHDAGGELLIPGTSYGHSNRSIGAYILAILEDIGWRVKLNHKRNIPYINQDVAEDPIRIYTIENTVHIRNPRAEDIYVRVFTLSGRLVYNRHSRADEAFRLLPQTIYIIKINDKSIKIRIP